VYQIPRIPTTLRYNTPMNTGFADLFDLDADQKHVKAKKDTRIGALIIPKDLAIDLYDERMGFPLINWVDKRFEIDLDGETLIIKRILDPNKEYPADPL
jgi:hypothetical protein